MHMLYPEKRDGAILKSKTRGFVFENGWWSESECPCDLSEAGRTMRSM